MAVVSFAQRLTDHATTAPDRVAITVPSLTGGDPETITWAEFDKRANRLGRDLQARGVTLGRMVTIVLPNGIDWFVAMAACWKIGAIPEPVSSRLPGRELAAIVELADPAALIGVDPADVDGAIAERPCLPVGYRPPDGIDDSPLPDAVSPSWKAPTSGGSTGRPKLILSGDPSTTDTEAPPPVGLTPGGCLVMPGPLYHNGPIVWSCAALVAGNHVVVLPKFDAEATLAAIERHRADVVYLVPTMMKRIWRLPEETRLAYDLSSLRIVWHLAEPCPPWLKEVWIEWLGPERIWELYAGTEAQSATVITGVEWLEHRGSVGKVAPGSFEITDDDGNVLPAGQMGEVWMRRPGTRETPTYTYIGAEPRTREGGWESLGDMGYLDEDGYLYLGDRKNDMILCGGSNVYPAEVEAAIQEHPLVKSCAVIGLPHEDLGNTIHAIVEADPTALPEADLLAFLGERLVRYKVPRSVEYVDEPLRDDAGKVRRSLLKHTRTAS